MIRIGPILFVVFGTIRATNEYDNARIVGSPKLICGLHSIMFNFETNVPFQGRISIVQRESRPECNLDYSININRNASFKIDIEKCTHKISATNGSKIYSAHVEIGFHPLVITSADRVFAIQCVDDSSGVVALKNNEIARCKHVVRHASRWDSSTVYRVGDSVVHEWTCSFERSVEGQYLSVLTSCNAISIRGEKIHLVDENGCIVDSELMGDLVYNNYQVKIYARAKMFRYMTGERHKIECQMQMCKKGAEGCGAEVVPPKCAFTKEEILERYERKNGSLGVEDNFKTNLLMEESKFEKMIPITSEWMTVHHSEYTNIDSLHDRYYISTGMDRTLIEMEDHTPARHFLMGISYREPKSDEKKSSIEEKGQKRVENKFNFSPVDVTQSAEILDTAENIGAPRQPDTQFPVVFIENITDVTTAKSAARSNPPVNTASQLKSSTTTLVTPTQRVSDKKTEKAATLRFYEEKITTNKWKKNMSQETTEIPVTSTSEEVSLYSTEETLNPDIPTGSIEEKTTHSTTTQASKRNESSTTSREQKGFTQTILLSTGVARKEQESSTSLSNEIGDEDTDTELSTTSTPFEVSSTFDMSSTDLNLDGRKKNRDDFPNRADWRLDDVSLNETETLRQSGEFTCPNATIIASEKKCAWSGFEQILLVWSFGSLLVWICLFGIFFYRHSTRRPDWVEYRRREMAIHRASTTGVLSPEHPWIHPDAFEEPRAQISKTQIDMSKF